MSRCQYWPGSQWLHWLPGKYWPWGNRRHHIETFRFFAFAPPGLLLDPSTHGSLLSNAGRKRHVCFCAALRLPVERVIFAAIPGPWIKNIYDRSECFT